ncbi:hypothetical protein Tco_0851608, partial [Tanacetum coccineum]
CGFEVISEAGSGVMSDTIGVGSSKGSIFISSDCVKLCELAGTE